MIVQIRTLWTLIQLLLFLIHLHKNEDDGVTEHRVKVIRPSREDPIALAAHVVGYANTIQYSKGLSNTVINLLDHGVP